MHTPVLLEEAISYLVWDPTGVYVDLTLGLGGHAMALLQRFPWARVIGVDWDRSSALLARERLESFGERFTFCEGNFADIALLLRGHGVSGISGFLGDLGPSSFQILQAGRGLSYQRDELLDMRLDRDHLPITAAQFLAVAAAEELERVFIEFGEIPRFQARSLARLISQHCRGTPPLPGCAPSKALLDVPAGSGGITTDDFVRLLKQISNHVNFWAKAFQALRLVVNHELENIGLLFKALPSLLAPAARVAIISFHSLEDRLIKRQFRQWQQEGAFKILTKKSITPTTQEIRGNHRARSARLRVIEKI